MIREPNFEERIDFLISVSRRHLKPGTSPEQVLYWWYGRSGQPDIYYAVAKLPYGWATVGRKMMVNNVLWGRARRRRKWNGRGTSWIIDSIWSFRRISGRGARGWRRW